MKGGLVLLNKEAILTLPHSPLKLQTKR